MRSIAEIDRDHEGMGKACVRHSSGCTYPACGCDRSKRIVPNVRGVGVEHDRPGTWVGIAAGLAEFVPEGEKCSATVKAELDDARGVPEVPRG